MPKARLLTRIAVAALAAVPLAAQTGPPASGDVVDQLAAGFEPWLAEFETIVGPIDRDRGVWEEAVGPVHRNRASGPIAHLDVAFSIDIYHFDPREEANVRLASWNVLFREGQEEALATLRRRLGVGRALDFAVGHPRRFGDLYLTPLPDGRFELSWYAEEPPWAVPPRDAAAEHALEDRLIAFLRSGVRDATIAAAFAPLAPLPKRSSLGAEGADWRVEVSPGKGDRPDWVSIEIRGQPLAAQRLIGSLGLREPGFIATDVHLSDPDLADLATGRRPVIDGYQIDARVDQDLLESIPAKRPGTGAWKAKSWRIRSLWLHPSR